MDRRKSCMRCFLLLSGIDFHAEDEGVDKQGSGEPGCFGIAIRARVKMDGAKKGLEEKRGRPGEICGGGISSVVLLEELGE